MMDTKTVLLKPPYLIFLGDVTEAFYAKTGAGMVQWCKDKVVGQLRMEDCKADLGLHDMTIEQAKQAGAKSLLIGVATIGGTISESWLDTFRQALDAGMDVISGLHTDLSAFPVLAEAIARSGRSIINVRKSPNNLPVGSGRKRTGMRLLTVGTDCAVGKKYSALSLTKAMEKRSFNATFRATGQTGILIAGSGIAVDAVVSDFLTGAAELISPDNEADHWDIIEGQGSMFNPSYSGVSMGLLQGSQPDAIVMCHDVERNSISTCPTIRLPKIIECIELHLQCARIVNPNVLCVGICVNTSSLTPKEKASYLAELSLQLGLPCVDPLIDGCDLVVDEIERQWSPY